MNRFLMLALCGSAAVTATLLCFSSPIVRIAFQHGAFASRDTSDVASVQSLSLLQLPFAVGIAFLTRVVASVKVNQILIPISAFGLLMNAGLNLVLMHWYSVAGIAAATVVAQGIVFVLLLMAVGRVLRT
jgi:putative peptidoglycan lipid II flippase